MVGFPAARKGDPVTHDMLVPSGVIGPPLTGPCPFGIVMIESLPAAHVNCTAVCTGAVSAGLIHPPPPGPPPPIVIGSAGVFIHGMPAARWAPSGDMAVCTSFLGDPKLTPTRTVLIGGPGVIMLPAPTSDFETTMQAIFVIKTSAFGKTPEGQKVVAKIEALFVAGKINMQTMAGSTRGTWTGSEINVNAIYNRDRDATASELVHEATHALNEDEFPGSMSKLTIDEEMRTNTNQLDLYEEQRAGGYRDPELERRRQARAAGTLRNDVRSRYPGAPEHL
ncbi:MAG TPA: hypothetical protein VFG47_03160 [Geminicoccaceae bacterium]|nr:hypothetical protein [Geminicoccaceae bacterium]